MKTFHEIGGYNQWIQYDEEGEAIEWNCTCQFGSTWRFSKNNIKLQTKCKHIKEVIENDIFSNINVDKP